MHIYLVASLSILLALVFGWGLDRTGHIEQDIVDRTRVVLSQTSPDTKVEVNGRDVRIYGEVQNEDVVEDLGTQVKGLWGVRASRNDLRTAALSLEQSPDNEQTLAQQSVDEHVLAQQTGNEKILAQQSQAEQLLMSQAPNEQEPDVDKQDFDFRANYDGKTLSMSGIVDTVAASDMLDSAPDMLPPGLVFDNTVETGAEVLIFSPDKLKTGIATLTQLKNGELRIDDEFFRLKGIADNPSRIDQIRKQIRASKETLKPLEVVLDIEVDPNNMLSAECKAKFGIAMENNLVHYVTGKHKIREQFIADLDYIANTAISCDARLLIEGHADEVGKENDNQDLSVRRANTARDFMIDSGVSRSRIEAFGYGEFRPVASNETQDGKAKNRRIEIHIQHINDLGPAPE